MYTHPISNKLNSKIKSLENYTAPHNYSIVFDDDPSSLHDFIQEFQFLPLPEVEKELRSSGAYSEQEIKETLEGLSELPGYAIKDRNTPKGRKTS